jgi:hypothetical protein
MDKLQAYLREKEAESPSPSLKERPSTALDRISMRVRSATRNVESCAERADQYGLKQHPYRNSDFEEIEGKANAEFYHLKSSDVLDSAKFVGDNRYGLFRDDLPCEEDCMKGLVRYDARKKLWAKLGYDWDSEGKIKKKLCSIRANKIQKVRDNIAPNLISKLKEKGITYLDMETARTRENYCVNELKAIGIDTKSKDSALIELVSSQFIRNLKGVNIQDFYSQNPDFYLIHSLGNSTNNVSAREATIQRGGRTVKVKDVTDFCWKDQADIVIGHQPSISCSVIGPQSDERSFYGPFGLLLDGGKIYHAGSQDAGSFAVTKELRLPHVESDPSGLNSIVNAGAKFGNTWNECLVARPSVKGVFLLGNMLSSEGNNYSSALAVQIAQYAQNRGLPLYRFDKGIGFREVDTRDLETKTGAAGELV